ncbi:hypothetical protein J437_LFUL013236 [Ladona fulva]|uniref:Protein regulator of cytokinesis 1 n=1 Tax=Ladona fulva TaxID=123851 RepID=A0A8K0K6U7_LADFU|nr:hypothetical protein J437_LFUL013236 [Ladona fulva]
MRAEIRDLWEGCLLGSEEESEFPAISSTNYTEELLELHDLEVLRLRKEVENSKNVLEYLGKWNRLYWKQIDLDDRVDDPDRLFDNRGGQLLKEEKERKAIQKVDHYVYYKPLHITRMITRMKDDIKTLNGLWKEMGFSKEGMENRMNLVEMHCRDMFKTMVEEEEDYKSRLKIEVKQFTDEVKHLANELKEDINLDFQFESLVSAENALKAQLERLRKIKEDRLKKYWALMAKDKCISLRLGINEYPASENSIPTAEYLKTLTKEIVSKESDLERLEKVYLEKREIILSLMNEMEIKPSTALEKNIASDGISSISLSKEFLNSVQCYHQDLLQQCQERKELAIQLRETLSLLWDRLCVSAAVREVFHVDHPGHGISTINALRQEIKRCEELKRQNIKQFVEKLRAEIRDLWEGCLLGSEEESEFPAISSTNYTEELLELHDLEVLRLRKEVENSKNVLEYLGKWNRLYWKQIDLDDRVDDPDRLFDNRGGQLLKEEKERKAIQKELPKVEEMLMKHYRTWCEIRGRNFIFEGLELSEYINEMWKKYHGRKEMEKMERKRAKEMLLDQEAKLGTQVSGSKRKCLTTPGKSPASSKVLRLAPVNDKKKTPSKVIQHSSRRLLEKPKDNPGDNLAAPLGEDAANHSIASTVATYADFTVTSFYIHILFYCLFSAKTMPYLH